jgi:hypothetical protein
MSLWFLVPVVGFVASVLILFRVSYQMLTMPRLHRVVPEIPRGLPRLSVVVPACNEGEVLESALVTLLASEHEDLEIILVNDRSTDDTGAIMDALAESDPRVRVVHIDTLPEGWLGKVHAMDVGGRDATGRYVLFADADVQYGPLCLARAVAWAEAESLDHLTLMPLVRGGTVLCEAVMSVFGGAYVTAFPPDAVNADVPGKFAGLGVFNMVRLAAFRRTEGWEWLRLEVADDTGLGLLMNRHGAKARFGMANEDLSIQWYGSVSAMVRGLEKNMFIAGAQGNPFFALLLGLFAAWPVLCLVGVLLSPWPWVAALAPVGMLGCGWSCGRLGFRPVCGALGPLTGPLLAWMLLRSAWIGWRNGSIEWRGTVYQLDALRAGQRLKMWGSSSADEGP